MKKIVIASVFLLSTPVFAQYNAAGTPNVVGAGAQTSTGLGANPNSAPGAVSQPTAVIPQPNVPTGSAVAQPGSAINGSAMGTTSYNDSIHGNNTQVHDSNQPAGANNSATSRSAY